MRVIIVGAEGFVGKYLVNVLKKRSTSVYCIDYKKGDDARRVGTFNKFANCDYVINLAAKSFVPASYLSPYEFYETNFLVTLAALEYCRKNNSKLIQFSSYIYGRPFKLPTSEEELSQSFNPYAGSKIISENICKEYNTHFNVPVTILRPFNIYGFGQEPSFLIPSIIQQAFEGKICLKDSRPKRDYVYVSDVISAIVKIIEKNKEGYNVYNLGSGKSFSVKEIVEFVKSIIGNKSIDVEFNQSDRKQEIIETKADIKKIEQELGWIPEIDIVTGLKLTIDNYR